MTVFFNPNPILPSFTSQNSNPVPSSPLPTLQPTMLASVLSLASMLLPLSALASPLAFDRRAGAPITQQKVTVSVNLFVYLTACVTRSKRGEREGEEDERSSPSRVSSSLFLPRILPNAVLRTYPGQDPDRSPTPS